MRRALLTILLLLFSWHLYAVQPGQVSDARPAEYMIYQYPNVSLVVKIEAPETEMDSKIYGPENALIKSSGIPGSRVGPLYQFIDAVDKPRQLMIKITPGRPVERSRISMELIQLPERDWSSATFAKAYNLFSSGTEEAHSNDSTTWSMKVYTLRNSARAFGNLGWEEMQLWSEFYAAHLVLHKLNDVLMAMELVQAVRGAARRAGFEEIELASLILEGEALQRAGKSTMGKVGYQRYEQLHTVLDQVVILADKLNLPSEKARALFSDGLAYQQQEQMTEAVGKFQSALDVALTTPNSDLTNEIRGTAASAYESQGSTAGAIELLEDIGNDLQSDAGQEFTDNLFEKGRILNNTYRYREASIELDQALSLQKINAAAGSWGATGLALARSYYSLGELEKARKLMLDAIPRTELHAHRSALIEAYDSLARIHRVRGQFDQMAGYREKQAELLVSQESRVSFLFESGIDAWKRGGSRTSNASDLMAQSARLAKASGMALAAYRAAIYECLLRIEKSGRGACTAASVRQPYDALVNSGIPWIALDAGLVKARILLSEGQPGGALSLLEGLVDDLLFFRQELPGVLGAWYWLTKGDVFQQYLEAAASGSNGKGTLVALDRVRLTEGIVASTEQEEQLRALLARREFASGAEASELGRSANAEWRNRRREFSPLIRPLDNEGLESLLSGLARDETILSYYFSGSAAYALLGSRKGVSMNRLGDSRTISGQLDRLQQNLDDRTGGLVPYLDALGKTLLQPLSKSLTQNIYLLPAGPLNGFPFDALRLDGAFLAEQHRVVNLMSLAGTSGLGSELAPGFRDTVFLAGNPQAAQALFSYDMQVSEEISAVRDAFVGPGLNIIQGVALQKDEFKDPRFAAAGLIHLAIPGTLDLATPDYSMLLMSRASAESVTDNLHPGDIRELDFQASLVVLSRTSVTARAQSGFDSNLGFVSDFLVNGASNVVFSLRSGNDSETAVFMADFYRQLDSSQSVSEALSRSKARLMKSTDSENFMSWAGFQLFIR
jgi:CHAT domain-containing protein/tetratricopeptide (TPR) repeat protein